MVDFRGGPPPAQGAAQLPPSLLQMAQGQAPQLSGDDRGGGPAQFDPMAGATAGAPPAYNPGTTVGGYNAVFDPRAPSAQGGWFTMADYLGQAPSPMQAAGWGGQSPDGRAGSWASPTSGGMQSPQMGPRAGGVNNNALSTNNWRLLGNDPDAFMINGTQVRRRKAQEELTGKSVMGQEGGGFPGYWPYGGGVWATPVSSYGWNQGYIGADSGWGPSSTPTY